MPRATALPVALLLIGALVFLYGGVESGFSGWAPTYLERTLGVTPADAALAMSIYWLSYVTGRVVSTALALRIGPAVGAARRARRAHRRRGRAGARRRPFAA